MIGKRIVFTFAGAAVLLSLSALVVYYCIVRAEVQGVDIEMTGESMASDHVSVQNEEAHDAILNGLERGDENIEPDTAVLYEAGGVPRLVVEIAAGHGAVDVFGTSQFAVVGFDSMRSEYYATATAMRYGEVVDDRLTRKRIEVTGYPYEYDESVQIAVVGRSGAKYEFSGEWVAENGERQDVSFVRRHEEHAVDTFTINLQNGQWSERRAENTDLVTLSSRLLAAEPHCDYDVLVSQLERALSAGGWVEPLSAIKYVWYGMYDQDEGWRLPYGYTDVCAVEMVWLDMSHAEPGVAKFAPSLLSVFSYDNSEVVANGDVFVQSPADGPLASANFIPFSETGDGVQFFEVTSQTKLVPVRFPVYTTCPCGTKERVILTAPMYPEEHPLRSEAEQR